MVRTWFGRGSDVVRLWFGCGSDVFFGKVVSSISLGTSLAFYTGPKRPLPRKPRKKSEKGFPGPQGGGSKNSKNDNFLFSGFLLVFDSFSSFFSPGAERPGNPFSDCFRDFLGRGLFDPCRRPTMSQHLPQSYLKNLLRFFSGDNLQRVK